MSWDDEDFEVPTTSATSGNWDDDFAETGDIDEPVLESWDADSDDEALAKKKKETKPAPAKPKAGKKGKKAAVVYSEIDLADPERRAELLKEAELNSDLNNAADLFGGLGVADHPRAKQTAALLAAQKEKAVFTKDTPLDSHPIFHPETKQDFEKLRKTLAPILTKLNNQSSLHYSSSLAIDLIRDLCEPLSVENTRKVTSTLNALVTKKQREERQARLSKTGGTATGGAGKKKAKGQVNAGAAGFKKDLDVIDDAGFDDDDDFM